MTRVAQVLLVSLLVTSAACVKKQPAATPTPQPPPAATTTPRPSPPPMATNVPPPPPVIPPDPSIVTSDPLAAADIEKINKQSPFQPIYFAYDSDALDDLARSSMSAHAEIMKKYGTG